MNKIAKNIFKTLLVSSFMSLVKTNATADNPKMPALDFNPDNDEELSAAKQRITHNVIKISPSGRADEVKMHRSHSSHSSHRSSSSGHYSSSHYSSTHYSSTHYSSSHYSSASSSSSSSTPSSSSSSSSSSKTSSAYSTPSSPGSYALGDRTINIGTYGSDVDALVDLLVKKRYLTESKLTKKSGFYIYNFEIVSAVKHFQKDICITASGNVDNTTISELKHWDAINTSIELGFRELAKGNCGKDVSKLVELLSIAGYQPNPEKTETKSGIIVFNEDVETAVKMYQAYNGLPVTGKADTQTINKLKTRK